LNKMYIVYKEARETRYWINLLKDSDYITDEGAKSLLDDCEELIKISGKIISSSKKTG
jgi:four helix bundle protein